MKFVNFDQRKKLQKGDFVQIINNQIPLMKVFGYVRFDNNGNAFVQSKNGVQNLNGIFYPIKPGKPARFWKIQLKKSKYKIFILID